MTTTPNLELEHIAEAQDAKEVTANEALDGLDLALTDGFAVDVSAGDESVTAAELRAAIRLDISGASVAGRVVTVPAIKRLFAATLDAGSAEPVTIERGSATVAIEPGAGAVLYTDGTTNGLVLVAGGAAGGGGGVAAFLDLADVPADYTGDSLKGVRVNAGETALEFYTRAFLGLADVPAAFTGAARAVVRVNAAEAALEFLASAYDVGVQIEAAPTASEIVLRFVFTRAVRFPAGMTGSHAKAGLAATATPSFALAKNGAGFGTVAWTAAGTTGGFAAASATDFDPGDVLTITAPGTPDATLALIGITLAGVRL